jgi:hypothetical protein
MSDLGWITIEFEGAPRLLKKCLELRRSCDIAEASNIVLVSKVALDRLGHLEGRLGFRV